MDSRHASLGRRTVLNLIIVLHFYYLRCDYKEPSRVLTNRLHFLFLWRFFISLFSEVFSFFELDLIFFSLSFFNLIWSLMQLEEIRQKRAAERLSKASSGPDLIKVSSPSGLYYSQNWCLRCIRVCLYLYAIILLISRIKTFFFFSLFSTETVGIKKSESGSRLSEVKSICTISFHVWK